MPRRLLLIATVWSSAPGVTGLAIACLRVTSLIPTAFGQQWVLMDRYRPFFGRSFATTCPLSTILLTWKCCSSRYSFGVRRNDVTLCSSFSLIFIFHLFGFLRFFGLVISIDEADETDVDDDRQF